MTLRSPVQCQINKSVSNIPLNRESTQRDNVWMLIHHVV